MKREFGFYFFVGQQRGKQHADLLMDEYDEGETERLENVVDRINSYGATDLISEAYTGTHGLEPHVFLAWLLSGEDEEDYDSINDLAIDFWEIRDDGLQNEREYLLGLLVGVVEGIDLEL